MIIVDNSGNIVSDADFRAANPLTSFPAVLQAQDVEAFGMNALVEAPQPAALPFYSVSPGAPAQVNGVWTQTWAQVAIDLVSAQAMQANTLSSACAAAIVAGFTSSALGSPHTYPSQEKDQLNLTASYASSLAPNLPAGWITPFWCADATGNWAWTSHTAAQIQQVGTDGNAAVLACQSQNATLQAQVAAATTVDAVAQVVWVAPATT
jgi:hypothetical protein